MNNDILQEAEPIHFEPVKLDATASWRRPGSFALISRLAQIAISDSELLLSSHHLPIAIDYVDDRLQVVAITTPQFQRVPLVDANGRWKRSYAPISLRCLPFRLVTDSAGAEALEMAMDPESHEAASLPVVGENGAPTPEIRQIVELLRRLEVGKRRLRTAAERLLIADVLTPFQMMRLPDATSTRSRALTVDRNKFSALSSRRAAHIAKDDFLPIDLAAACLFSQRLMPGLISVASEPVGAGDTGRQAGQPGIDFRSSTQLDGSELFSFEAFSKTDNCNDRNS